MITEKRNTFGSGSSFEKNTKMFIFVFKSYLLSMINLFISGQVESIVLSIISMLSSPNDESPANVEAAVSDDEILFYLIFWQCNSVQ